MTTQREAMEQLQARVEALESEARWRANGAFIDKPDPALADTEQDEKENNNEICRRLDEILELLRAPDKRSEDD